MRQRELKDRAEFYRDIIKMHLGDKEGEGAFWVQLAQSKTND